MCSSDLATIGDAFIAGIGSAWEYVAGVADYWNGVLEFAGRIGNLFYGAFKLLEAVGNGVGFVITKATAEIAGLLGAAAEWIPGASQFAADMKALQSSSQGAANAYWEAGEQNLTAAGDAFGAVVASSASEAASTEKGPLAGMITDAAEKARQNMMAKSEAQKQTVGGKEAAEVVGPSTAALKATDSRSKEGVAEMFRLMRGDSGLSIAEQQLEEQRKTNELLSEADPEAIMQMVGG